MCRSIKVLRRPDEPATPDELNGAALQFVRKISGFHKPSRANQEAFDRAVREIGASSERLLASIAANGVGQARPPVPDGKAQPSPASPDGTPLPGPV